MFEGWCSFVLFDFLASDNGQSFWEKLTIHQREPQFFLLSFKRLFWAEGASKPNIAK